MGLYGVFYRMQPMMIPSEEPGSAPRPRPMPEPCPDDASRFEQCYLAHRDHVYRLGLRYGGNRTAFAEDLTHDVFLKLWTSGRTLDEIENIRAWLHTASANLAVSRLRAEKSLLGRLSRWFTGGTDPTEERSPQVMLELQESAALASRALSSLP